MATSYYKLAEEIRTIDAGMVASDDYPFDLRFIGEQIAIEVAIGARKNAFENSNQGETTYASDLFTSTFLNIPVTYDGTLKQFYSGLPQTPPSLPSDQEIVSVIPNGIQYRRRQVIPMKNKDKFMQDLIGPIRGTILYYIENGNIYYDNITEFMFSSVNMTMVGAVSTTGTLLDGVLNVPKDVEGDIITNVLIKLKKLRNPADILNDARNLPTAV